MSGVCDCSDEISRCIKCGVCEDQLASQEGLCFMRLVSWLVAVTIVPFWTKMPAASNTPAFLADS